MDLVETGLDMPVGGPTEYGMFTKVTKVLSTRAPKTNVDHAAIPVRLTGASAIDCLTNLSTSAERLGTEDAPCHA